MATYLVIEHSGEVEGVSVDTLPGQTVKQVSGRVLAKAWPILGRCAQLGALVGPSLGLVGVEDRVGEGGGDKGEDEGDGAHYGGEVGVLGKGRERKLLKYKEPGK